jgi:peptidoglycan L-alanyl-D-glutamate endopeptidase CwlK
MPALQNGSRGDDVKRLQEALQQRGFYTGIIDGSFDGGTETAVRQFQTARGLKSDGVAGVITKAALDIIMPRGPDICAAVTVETAMRMMPDTSRGNVTTHLPNVLAALEAAELSDRCMILMALATIYVETGQFAPLVEFQGDSNTSPGGHPYDRYDNRADLGNRGAPDGDTFKGRGFVQVTGRNNYGKYGPLVGADLIAHPDLALDSVIASKILAAYLKGVETAVRVATAERSLEDMRRTVNGGINGLDMFSRAYTKGETLFPAA